MFRRRGEEGREKGKEGKVIHNFIYLYKYIMFYILDLYVREVLFSIN